jgi:hypothetical protein
MHLRPLLILAAFAIPQPAAADPPPGTLKQYLGAIEWISVAERGKTVGVVPPGAQVEEILTAINLDQKATGAQRRCPDTVTLKFFGHGDVVRGLLGMCGLDLQADPLGPELEVEGKRGGITLRSPQRIKAVLTRLAKAEKARVAAREALPPLEVVSARSIGPLRIGMKRGEVQLPLRKHPSGQMGDHFRIAGPYRIVFDGDRVAAIEIDLADVSSVRVGTRKLTRASTEAELSAAFPACQPVVGGSGGVFIPCDGGRTLIKLGASCGERAPDGRCLRWDQTQLTTRLQVLARPLDKN